MLKYFRRQVAKAAGLRWFISVSWHACENLFLTLLLIRHVKFAAQFTYYFFGGVLSFVFIACAEMAEILGWLDFDESTKKDTLSNSQKLRSSLRRVNDHFFDASTTLLVAILLLILLIRDDFTGKREKSDQTEEEENAIVFFELLFAILLAFEVFSAVGDMTPVTLFYLLTYGILEYLSDKSRGIFLLVATALVSPFVLFFYATDTRHAGFLGVVALPVVCITQLVMVMVYPYVALGAFFPLLIRQMCRKEREIPPQEDDSVFSECAEIFCFIAEEVAATLVLILRPLESNPTTRYHEEVSKRGKHWIFTSCRNLCQKSKHVQSSQRIMSTELTQNPVTTEKFDVLDEADEAEAGGGDQAGGPAGDLKPDGDVGP